VLQAMAHWGNRYFPDSWRVPQEFHDPKAP